MSDQQNQGFGKFVPGFDFLQNLAKGASQALPQMPNISNWVAPTLSVEELEKRISELKAVHFWLDQNSKALGATIQALEVQKMTLATLQGMNFNMGEIANALKLRATDTMEGMQKMREQAVEAAGAMASAATSVAGAAGAGGAGAGAASTRSAGSSKGRRRPARGEDAQAEAPAQAEGGASGKTPAAPMVDPLQWWGALTQQFQQIAATALKEAAMPGASDTAGKAEGSPARSAHRKAADAAGAPARGAARAPRKKAAKKTSARKTA